MKKTLIILLNTLCGGILGVILCVVFNIDLARMAQYDWHAAAELFTRTTVFGIVGSVLATAFILFAYKNEA